MNELAEIIRRKVAAAFGVTVAELESKTRTDRIAWTRQIAVKLIRRHTTLKISEVGKLFGNRTHGAIIHAAAAFEERITIEPKTAVKIAIIELEIFPIKQKAENEMAKETV